MNKHAFRLIFSRRLHLWLAVSEVSRGEGKATKATKRTAAVGLLVAAALGAVGIQSAPALHQRL
jgi:Extended Signal Peptide of Type V secretion system